MRETSASEQTYRQLTDALRHGVFSSGSRLPPERGLASQFGVSRVTLRKALNRLAAEGLLESVLGSGWFVRPQVVGEPPSVLQTFSEMARARGMRPTARVVTQQVRPATPAETDQLNAAPGAEVLEIVRLRGMDATVICLDSSVLPLSIAAGLRQVDLADESLYEQLEVRCGVRIDRSSYSVHADVADADLAGLLGVEVGRPVLVGEETGYDETGHPLLIGISRYRGDSYRFQADLFRPR